MVKKAAVAETAVETKAAGVVTSFKGFDHELKCRGFQFEVGKTYTVEGKIEACHNGFHAVGADNPFHVWDFYPIIDDEGRLARYAEVIQSGDMSLEEDGNKRGTKIASASITISAELTLPDFIKKAVSRIVETTRGKGDDASGHSAQIGSSGDSAKIGSSGDSAKIGSSGHYAKIGSSGHSAKIDVSGADGVAASAGVSARVKAKAGTWVSVAEFDESYPPKCIGFATGKVGDDGIPADTWLIAKGGKLIPA